jgi:hypothetical protein
MTRMTATWLAALTVLFFTTGVNAQEVEFERETNHWERRGIVLAFGMEGMWGVVHPHGRDLKNTLEVYDFDPYPGLFNLNLVGEVLFAVSPNLELGVHGAYNGLLDANGPAGPANLTTQEIGGVARIILGAASRRAHGEVGFRFEGGVMLADFEVDGISENHTTGFVRPALTIGGGGSDVGTELSFGWTFAQVDRGLGRATLPLGGLDLTLLIRIAP